MSNNPTDVSDLVGFLKPIFGDLQMVIPEEAQLQEMFDFDPRSTGKYFSEPVQVIPQWGVTYAGTSGDSVSLNDALPMKTQEAQVTPASVFLRDQLSMILIARAGQASGNKRQAFEAAGKFSGMSLAKHFRRLIEISMICGQSGIMTVLSWDDTGVGGTITVDPATLRPGILSFLEGAKLDFYQSNGTTPRDASDNATGLAVDAVNVDAGTIHILTEPTTDPAAGDIIFIHGSQVAAGGTYNEMVGLRKQIQAQTGVVFNIDKALYSQWRGNVVTSVGMMSQGVLTNAVSRMINRGFQGTAVAVLSPKQWAVLNQKVTSQQIFDSSYSKSLLRLGTNGLEMSQNGVTVEIVSSAYQADGEFFVLPKEYVKRIGTNYSDDSTGQFDKKGRDISFARPLTSDYVYEVPGTTAVELMVQTDQQVYLQRPAWSVLCTGVTF